MIRNNLNKSDWEITKDKCDSTRAHRRHLAANGKHEMKRKIYCTNVHLRIIEILITSVYNWVLSLLPLQYRGGSYLFGQYVVCAMCCVACPFGGSIAPSQTCQWTSYCASPFSILSTINYKPNLRGGKLVWRSQSDALGARCVFCNFPYFHVPTWEVALVTFQSAPSGAHMWDRRSLVSSDCV